jgi:hypothetical protein
VDLISWIMLGLASLACYGGLFIVGSWIFRCGYQGH